MSFWTGCQEIAGCTHDLKPGPNLSATYVSLQHGLNPEAVLEFALDECVDGETSVANPGINWLISCDEREIA